MRTTTTKGVDGSPPESGFRFRAKPLKRQTYSSLLDSGYRSDLRFIVNDSNGQPISIDVHKLIISMASTVLDKIIYEQECEIEDGRTIVHIQDADYSSFNEMLKFIYFKNVQIEKPMVLLGLYKLGKRFQIVGLVDAIFDVIKNQGTIEVACVFNTLADDDQELLNICQQIIGLKISTKPVSNPVILEGVPAVREKITDRNENISSTNGQLQKIATPSKDLVHNKETNTTTLIGEILLSDGSGDHGPPTNRISYILEQNQHALEHADLDTQLNKNQANSVKESWKYSTTNGDLKQNVSAAKQEVRLPRGLPECKPSLNLLNSFGMNPNTTSDVRPKNSKIISLIPEKANKFSDDRAAKRSQQNSPTNTTGDLSLGARNKTKTVKNPLNLHGMLPFEENAVTNEESLRLETLVFSNSVNKSINGIPTNKIEDEFIVNEETPSNKSAENSIGKSPRGKMINTTPVVPSNVVVPKTKPEPSVGKLESVSERKRPAIECDGQSGSKSESRCVWIVDKDGPKRSGKNKLYTRCIYLTEEMANELIAAKAFHIKRIRKASGAGMYVMEDPEAVVSKQNYMSIKGTKQQILDGLELTKTFLEAHDFEGMDKMSDNWVVEEDEDKTSEGHSEISEECVEYIQQDSEPDPDELIYRFIIITDSMAGVLIGKGGTRIQELKACTGCKVVIGANDGNAHKLRVVRLTGTSRQINCALTIAKTNLEENGFPGIDLDADDWAGAANEEDGIEYAYECLIPTCNENFPCTIGCDLFHTREILVPKFMTGAIIGSFGANIREMQAITSCEMDIRNAEDGQFGKIMYVTGEHYAILHALVLVKKCLAAHQYIGVDIHSDDWTTGQQLPEGVRSRKAPSQIPVVSGRFASRFITIPAIMAGAIIGHKGRNIKDVENATGCKLHIDDDQDDSKFLFVSGKPDAIRRGLEMVKQSLEHFGYFGIDVDSDNWLIDDLSDASSKSENDYTPEEMGADGDEDVMHRQDFNLPKKMADALIGPSGRRVKQIRSETGAAIHVMLPETADGDRVMRLRGTQAQVDRASIIMSKLFDHFRICSYFYESKHCEHEEFRC